MGVQILLIVKSFFMENRKKVIRFQRDTIRSCHWEICMVFHTTGEIELHSMHLRKEDYHLIKEKNEWLTPKKAENYIEKNKQYIIETYYP